jgi:hypothetical protein
MPFLSLRPPMNSHYSGICKGCFGCYFAMDGIPKPMHVAKSRMYIKNYSK